MVNNNRKYVMFSFDTEEFDIPCEYGYRMPLNVIKRLIKTT